MKNFRNLNLKTNIDVLKEDFTKYKQDYIFKYGEEIMENLNLENKKIENQTIIKKLKFNKIENEINFGY